MGRDRAKENVERGAGGRSKSEHRLCAMFDGLRRLIYAFMHL